MDMETYRYLMSALIQVFGTIVAVDAIFYLFIYEQLNNKFNHFLEKLEFCLYSLENKERIIGADEAEYDEFVRSSKEAVFYKKKGLNHRYEQCMDKLKGKKADIENIGKNDPEDKKDLQMIGRSYNTTTYYYKKFNDIDKQRDKIIIFISLSMAIPAVLSLYFSYALVKGYRYVNCLEAVADRHIFFAVLGFLLIILLATYFLKHYKN